MKKHVQVGLQAVGLEVQRCDRRSPFDRKRSHPETSGAIIEFIGFNGVGKTTFMTHVHRLVRDRWMSTRELTLFYDLSELSRHVNDDVSALYQELLRRRVTATLDGESIHGELRFKAESISWHASSLIQNLALESGRIPIGVMKDEGITSNCGRELSQMITAGYPGIADWFRSRHIVHIGARPQQVVKQLRQRRIESPDGIAGYPDKTEDEIVDLVCEESAFYDLFVEQLSDIGVHNLSLSQEDGTQANTNRFLAFERTIGQSGTLDQRPV